MTLPLLDRRAPADDKHVQRYPFSAAPPARPVPVTLGVNWYDAFDRPVKIGNRWWIAAGTSALGRVRGGHCVCAKPDSLLDQTGWHVFYDQGREGACVGFGSSRMMTLLNRCRYDARWLWNQAKQIDEWPDTNPGDDNGTSVRAAMDVLRAQGHRRNGAAAAALAEGIAANRWARTVDEIRAALASPLHDRLQAIPVLNSWGRSYPQKVWMPYTVLERLLREDGEATVVTDR